MVNNDVGNFRVCEAFRMRKSSGMLRLELYVDKKKSIYGSLMFDLLPEDENSSLQIWRVTYDFNSPVSFDTRIGESAIAKWKLCYKLRNFICDIAIPRYNLLASYQLSFAVMGNMHQSKLDREA